MQMKIVPVCISSVVDKITHKNILSKLAPIFVLTLILITSVFSVFPKQAQAVWTERTSAGTRNWISIATSADGTKLAAVAKPGYIYTSANSGATWTERTSAGSKNWQSIAMSSDGTKLVAAVFGGDIWTSIDSGATWTDRTSAGLRNWYSVSSSSDGTILMAANDDGWWSSYIYTSLDSGATWTQQTGTGANHFWRATAISADGTKMAAAANNDSIYISNNTGATWTRNDPNYISWTSITMSSDGTKLAAAAGAPYQYGNPTYYVYTSIDGGTTWIEQTGSAKTSSRFSIASSANGTKLATADYGIYGGGDYISKSADSGTTWSNQTAAGQRLWKSIASSADGSKLSAVVFGGSIWTYTPTQISILTTEDASSITQTGSILNGTITNIGEENSSVRGFDYGPTISYGTTTIENGSFGAGAFTKALTGLSCSTLYHFRSYSINSGGRANGNDMSFTTSPCTYPSLSTTVATNITMIGVTLNGNILNIGQDNSTTRGFEYGLTTSYGTITSESGSFGLGAFTKDITGLNCGNTYHVRSYAINTTGKGNGNDLTFTTSACSSSGWVQRTSAGINPWMTVASSADGTKLIASSNNNGNGYIYMSTDSGVTWVKTTAAFKFWMSLASSADGTKLAAAAYNDYIWTSTDSGATWTQQTAAGLKYWYKIVSSSNGTILGAWNGSDSRFSTSSDGGATWTIQYGASGVGQSITMSSLGDKIAGMYETSPAFILTSSNYGVTWTKQLGSDERRWGGITSSADGNKIAATNGGPGILGYIFTSSDSGVTWIQRISAGYREWRDIASSSDGNTLIATTNYGYTYLSRDSGNTWIEQTSTGPRYWKDISSSTDGSKFITIGCDTNCYLYTYTQANISTLDTNPATSILSNGATLNGYISNTGGEVSSVRGFEYGIDTSYGKNTIENGAFGIGAFTKNVSALICETTYHYRSYTTNGGGNSYGGDQTFTTGACSGIPVIGTDLATNISPTSVTLNGNITDIGLSNPTIRGFEYGLTTNYSVSNTGNGSFGVGSFTKNVSALVCGSTYHYRSFATNATGTGYGQDTTFNTSPCIYPTLTTNTASLVTSISATLSANISNTGGVNPTVRGFEYGTTISYGTSTIENGAFGIGSYTKSIASLTCATLYHFRSYATNSNGKGVGNDQTFTTGTCSGLSTLTTEAATSISLNGVTFNGTITNTSGENPTIRGFEYGTTISYGTSTIENGSFGTGAYTKNVSTLTCGTLYHFRSYATNSGGSGYGNDQTFTTGTCSGISILTTEASTSLTSTSTTLNGSITNTSGANPTIRGFEYGTTISYGTTVNESGTFGISSFSINISSLICATLYHFRSYATNSVGTGYGSDQTFTTNSCTLPNLTTNNATSIVKTAVTLNGAISNTGGENSTIRGFEYGLDTSYGTQVNESGAFGIGSFAKNVSALACGTLYHYRSYATNSGGTGVGNDQTFTTGTCSGTIGWTSQYSAGAKQWYIIASSTDGTKLAAAVSGDYIYTSTDSGLSWTAQINSGISSWISIASSTDGNKLVAIGTDFSGWGYLYTSTDSGVTWIKRTGAGNRTWASVASSSDGKNLVAAVNNSDVFTSTDSGTTWTERTGTGSHYWGNVAVTSSADGMKLAIVYFNGLIQTSTDGGVTWIPQANSGMLAWSTIVSSADGTKLAAATSNSYIYTSIDSGVTWTAQTSSGATHYFRKMFSSPDGSILFALDYSSTNSYIYKSVNSGVTWTTDALAGSRKWQTISASSDGSKLTAANSSDYFISTYGDINMPKPIADTAVITGVSTVTLNGLVDTDHTTRGFEYGLTTSYGNTTTENGTFHYGPMIANISSITPGVTYHYRSYATNLSGTGYSEDNTFILEFQNWTPKTSAGSRSWSAVASSTDGNKLVAVVQGGYIYTSTDGGTTWTERNSAGSRQWKAVASSADGTKLAVANGNNGFIYTSTDSGVTWTLRTSSGLYWWMSLTSSADGTKLAATTGNGTGYIFTSADSGVTWLQRSVAGSHSFNSIISSADGTKLAATAYSDYIYTSIDSGVTWVQRTNSGSHDFYSISSSADGTKLAAASHDLSGSIYTSTDSGATWIKRTSAGVRSWKLITSSSDGTKIVAIDVNSSTSTGSIYISNDSGVNWIAEASAGLRDWYSLTSSADGSKLIAGVNGNYLYSYALPTSPNIITNSTTLSTGTSVTLNGQIVDNKGDNSSVRGFQYGLTTSYGTNTTENGSFGIGVFSTNITGLIANTTYHYRSYATNSLGTSYSDDATFEIKPFVEQTTSGKRYWYAIAASADGVKLAAVDYGGSNTGSIYTSTDSGANWIQRTTSTSLKWLSITSSADGTKLAAAAYPGYIYTSLDSGVTWVEQTNSASCNWNSITSSSDGSILAAVGTNCIYTSEDSGETWTSRTNSGLNGGNSITSSSDGIKMAATNGLGYIYLSGDSGTTWTAQASSGSHTWRDITSSADGTKLAAVDYTGTGGGGYIYTSTDSGVTWTQQLNSGARNWMSITSSSDGTKLAAVVYNNYIYTSIDSGVTWTQQTSEGQRYWYAVASSYDGVKIIAGAQNNNIFTNTIPEIPLVNTGDASSLTVSSAVLNATIENLSGEYPTSKGFEYGLDTSYGNTVVINGASSQRSYAMDVTALAEDTTYHYKSYATNTVGTGFGEDQTFTTFSVEEITSFNNLSIVGGAAGSATYSNAAAVQAILPSTVSATTNTGPVFVPVTSWTNTDSYNPAIPGSYTFTSVLGSIPVGYANSGNYVATIEVLISGTATGGGKIDIRGGGGGGTSTSVEYNGAKLDPINGLIPKSDELTTAAASGCLPGSLFSTTTGKSCAAITPTITKTELTSIVPVITTTVAGCTSGSLFSTTTGKSCGITNPTTSFTPLSNTPSTISFKKVLRQGVKSPEVKELQMYLNTKGYACGIADGSFGPNTKKAVMDFQAANNLKSDGVVGKISIRVMNGN
jgi:photosystem II stability/assembly factor-like uncharacterized protein